MFKVEVGEFKKKYNTPWHSCVNKKTKLYESRKSLDRHR